MIATKFSMLQHVCIVPFARATLHRSFTVSASASTTASPSRKLNASSSSSSRTPHVDPRVLLGMSEHDLQQLAVEFGQQSYRGKQLHHLIYMRKAKEIQDFSHLPQGFRNDLIEAGWKIGRKVSNLSKCYCSRWHC
ncbi:hypothetical protein HRI_000003800 [Hibiscus trionum]|uniref:Uncharacterized protein n=1 Tax=Hibiscus trionum TaxID=183268 RepID=A0A9W7GPE7_HIBTR|nr:hypothetical protein HRI_000003800 [Hibiscus trionum]